MFKGKIMQKLTDSVFIERHGRVAAICVANPPVNALSWHVRDGIAEGLQSVSDDLSVDLIVIRCVGKTFLAGADIREFGQPPKGVQLPAVISMIEDSPKPVIAIMHGTVLGGGLEVALACHYRVAVPGTKFGLPEVKLGLLPGAGGTQRLPRIIGPLAALDMMVTGEPVDTVKAISIGLIDREVADLGEDALTAAKDLVAGSTAPRRIRDSNQALDEARSDADFFTKYRQKIARKTRGFDAPEAIVQCVEDACRLPFDDAIAEEKRRFLELESGVQSMAQRYYFFAERQAAKFEGSDASGSAATIQSVGVLGAGTMGGGISMNFLNIGLPVKIYEPAPEPLERGLGVIRANYDRSIRSGRFTEQAVNDRMAMLSTTTDMQDLADCDLIIEAVYEDLDLKKSIFAQLDSIAKDDAILATNTSCLDVNQIAAATERPSSVLGLHFFSPANVMKLLEVIRGDKTSNATLSRAMTLAKRINKVPVISGVCDGFIGNRMLAQRAAQAQKLILEGCMPWDVDRVLVDFGMPMGPFAMDDLAGLDLGWTREKSTGATIKERLCELDRRGQKNGSGYYDYDAATGAARPSDVVSELIHEFSLENDVVRREFSNDEILYRLLLPMINEGMKILEEGIAARPSDVDVVWVNGYGWPVYRGGPMFYADQVGVVNVVSKLEEFAAIDNDDFWEPAKLLKELAVQGKPISSLN